MIDITRKAVESAYREESWRVLATLIRLLGDFELVEETLHDAYRRLNKRPEACTAYFRALKLTQ